MESVVKSEEWADDGAAGFGWRDDALSSCGYSAFCCWPPGLTGVGRTARRRLIGKLVSCARRLAHLTTYPVQPRRGGKSGSEKEGSTTGDHAQGPIMPTRMKGYHYGPILFGILPNGLLGDGFMTCVALCMQLWPREIS